MSNKFKVEDFLGNSKKRYFGNGHRATKYKITDKRIDSNLWACYAEITQEESWSVKGSSNLQQHLSTIDVLILGVMGVEKYLKEGQQDYKFVVENLVLTTFDIKPGGEAFENLNSIPIIIQEFNIPNNEEIKVKLAVGNMKIQLEFVEVIGDSFYEKNRIFESIDYINNHLKYREQQITDIEINSDNSGLTCEINNINKATEVLYSGIQSAHQDKVSIIEWIISLAQAAQVLAYNYDNIDRMNSENFWMRGLKVKYNPTALINLNERMMFNTQITRTQTLKIENSIWRTFTMHLSDTMGIVEISTKLAHEINNDKQSNNKLILK